VRNETWERTEQILIVNEIRQRFGQALSRHGNSSVKQVGSEAYIGAGVGHTLHGYGLIQAMIAILR